MALSERCSTKVWGQGAFRPFQCSRWAVNTEGGKGYCKQHTPSLIKAKREAEDKARDVAWKLRQARDRRNGAISTAKDALLVAVREAEGLPKKVQAALDALLKAEGESSSLCEGYSLFENRRMALEAGLKQAQGEVQRAQEAVARLERELEGESR